MVPDGENGGVLIVDDHPDQCKALSILLRRRGHRVHFVESGHEALDYVSLHPPTLILLDVMMPEMSGFDVLKMLRRDPRFRPVHVYMYSAVDDPRWREEARQLGAEGYLIKGELGLEELFGRIENHLTSSERRNDEDRR